MNLAPWWLLGLAVLGGANAVFFLLAYYGRVRSREVPAALCRSGEQSCVSTVRTPYARLFGLPNSLWGLAFYLLTALVAARALAGGPPGWLERATLLTAAVAVLLIPYLVWALAAKLKTWCRL